MMMRSVPFLLFVLLLSAHISCFALKPSHMYVVAPDTLGVKYEQNTIITADGVHLKSWTFLPPDSINNKTTLVVARADVGNMSWSVNLAAMVAQYYGYTVTLFDYRGFGESDGFDIDTNHLYYNEFVKDLAAAVTFERSKYPANKTGVWAFSMGTIITTLLPVPAQPDFVIGDSYVVNMQQVVIAYKAKKNRELLLPPGADQYEKKVYKINKPMLIFAGSEDKSTPEEEVMKLKTKLPGVTIVTYNGGHMEGFMKLSQSYNGGSEYIHDMREFTEKLK
jgi:predicted alpha/beta-fold hydrolase